MEIRISLRHLMLALAILLVGGTLIGAFIIVGSPAEQRALRLDQQRSNDLNNLHYAIIDIRARTQSNSYIDSLDALKRDSTDRRYLSYNDPATNAPYEYHLFNPDTYQLCAVFEVDTSDHSYKSNYSIENRDFGIHPAGHTCFVLPVNKILP